MSEMWPWITLILLGAYHGLNPGMGWLFAVALGLQERSRRAVIRAFAPIALGHAASIAVVVALVAALQSVISPALLRWAGAGALVSFGLYKLIVPMSCPRWVGMRVGFRELTAWSFLMATACGAGLMVVPVLLKLPSERPAVVQVAPAAQSEPGVQKAEVVPAKGDLPMACHTETPGGKEAAAPIGQGVHASVPDAPAHGTEAQPPACHTQVARMAKQGGAGPFTAMAAVLLHTLAMFLVMAGIALVVFEKIGLAILRRAWFNLDLLWAGALIGAGLLTLLV